MYEGRAVMFLDPGVVTGWAMLSDGSFRSGESVFQDVGAIVRDFCIPADVTDPAPLVGWEAFNITPETYRMKGSAIAIEVIGVIRWVTTHYLGECLPPSARQVKNSVPDAMLKALGWHRAGHGGHANDAARHLTAWLIKNRLLTDGQQQVIHDYLQSSSS